MQSQPLKVWVIIGIMFYAEGMSCQDFNYSDSLLKRKNIIHLLGYSRVIERFKRPVILTTDIPLELTFYKGIQLSQIGLSAGGHILIRNKNKFKTAVKSNLTIISRYGSQRNYKSADLGFTTGILNGWYSPHWFFAGEISSTFHIIRNYSEEFQKLYNGALPGGWYHPGYGLSFSYGALAGYTIKQRSDIILRFDGILYVPSVYDLLPHTITVQLNYRFQKQYKKTMHEN